MFGDKVTNAIENAKEVLKKKESKTTQTSQQSTETAQKQSVQDSAQSRGQSQAGTETNSYTNNKTDNATDKSEAKIGSLFKNYFRNADSAVQSLGSSADDAREEQRLMRYDQRIREEYDEEYDKALQEYNREQGIKELYDSFGANGEDEFLKTVKDLGLESEFEAVANGQYSEDAIDNFAQKVERKQKQLALSSLAQSAGKIEENFRDGTGLAQEIKSAASEEEVRNILLKHCNNNENVADTVYGYLMQSAKKEETGSTAVNNENPFNGRNVTELMGLMYTNTGDKYVLNENLLKQFSEYEYDGTYDENGYPNAIIKSAFYTNFNGDICTVSYDYVDKEESETGKKYIRLNFEDGESTQELKYYMTKNQQEEDIYHVINPPNEDIEETVEDFTKRLTVMQNYTTELPDDTLSKEEINEKYELLAQYDNNVSASLDKLMSEFQSQGVADDVRNWFVSLLGTPGIDDKEITNEVGAAVSYTQIFMNIDNGNLEEAQKAVDEELDRRLATANTYQDVYNELKQYYQDDKTLLEIMNSSAVLGDDEKYLNLSLDESGNVVSRYKSGEISGINTPADAIKMENIKATGIEGTCKKLTKEEMYSFLTYGGEFTTENLEDYKQKSEDFTDYNTAVAYGAMLQQCETPEDTFRLITGKSINDPNLSDEDIKKFNDFYNIDNAKIQSYMSDADFFADTASDPLMRDYGPKHYQMSIQYSKGNGFEVVYRDIDDNGTSGDVKTVSCDDLMNMPYYIRDKISSADGAGYKEQLLKQINNSGYSTQLGQQKFSEFYNQNKEQIDEYIKAYAESQGISADEILNNPDKLYSESCNYMQYTYITAKQKLQGDSRFENMTNQYCMEMDQYASNVSHVLSMGCMAASVIFPAAAPILMTGAKIAGYLDNGIDLLNMITNKQSYKDYVGWGTSLAYEIATKAGYRFFSNVAGDWSQESLEKVIDNNIFGLGNILNDNELAQVLYRGASEALIETGICLPYTMALNYMQGGKYDFGKEMLENFIYDFMPYARGWQDVLLKGNDPNFKVYTNTDENGKYYTVNGDGNKIYLDKNNQPRLIQDSNGNTIKEYIYNGDGSYKLIETDKNGQTSTSVVTKNPDGTLKVTTEDGRVLQNTEIINGVYVTRYYDDNGNEKFAQTTDKKGHVISTEQNGIKVEYGLSGKPKSAVVTTSNGDTVNVKYSTVFGVTTMKIGDDSYKLNEDGTVDINGRSISQNAVMQSIIAGVKPEVFADIIDMTSSGEKPTGEFNSADNPAGADKPAEEQMAAEEKAEFNQEQYDKAINEYYLDEETAQKVAQAGLTEEQFDNFQQVNSRFHMVADIEDRIKISKIGLNNEQLDELLKWQNNNMGKNTSVTEVAARMAKYNTSPAAAAMLAGLNLADSAVEERVYDICKTYQGQYAGTGFYVMEDIVKLAESNLSSDDTAMAFRMSSESSISLADSALLVKSGLSSEQQSKAIEYIKEGFSASDSVKLTTDFESMKEYYDAYKDLKNLKNANGEPLFGQEVSKETAESLKARGKYIEEIGGKYYALNNDSTAYFASKGCNNEIIIDMVQQGYLPEKILEKLPEMGEINQFINDDLDKICSAYYSGKPIEDVFVPKVTEENIRNGRVQLGEGEEIPIKTGDVIELDGHERPCIINEDGSVTELNMSKEAYLKLFPPVERYATVQNGIGNCWECSGFNAVFRDPNARHYVVDMFSEDANGNVTITYPNSGRSYTFENGKLPDGTDMRYYSQGAPAVQMLEWADGREIQAERRDKVLAAMTEDDRQSLINRGLMDENGNFTEDAYVDKNGNVYKYSGSFPTMYEASRESGRSYRFFEMAGMENVQHYDLKESGWNGLPDNVRENISNAEYFKTHIVTIGTPPKAGSAAESELSSELGMVSSHAYQLIAGEVAEDGTILSYKVLNPHGMVEVELTPDELTRYVNNIDIASKGNGVSEDTEKPFDEKPVENTASGAGEKINIDDLYSEKMGNHQLAKTDEDKIKSLLSKCSDPESALDKLNSMSDENLSNISKLPQDFIVARLNLGLEFNDKLVEVHGQLTEKLSEMGISDERERQVVVQYLLNSAVIVDSEKQVEIMASQLTKIQPDENTFILAPQEKEKDGTIKIKSFTRAARDLIEIANGQLDPDKARTSIDLSTGGDTGSSDAKIILADDCSVTGNSMIEDALTNLDIPLNKKGVPNPIAGNKTIYITPTVSGEDAVTKLGEFCELFGKIHASDADAVIKHIGKGGWDTELTDNQKKLLECLRGVVDCPVGANGNNRYYRRLNNLLKQVKRIKGGCEAGGGTVNFELVEGATAYKPELTDAYQQCSKQDQDLIDRWATVYGCALGYHDCGTNIIITGREGNSEMYKAENVKGLSEEAKTALGIGEGLELPPAGNAPNNNSYLSQVLAELYNVDPRRIKPSGITRPETYASLARAGYVTENRTMGEDLSVEKSEYSIAPATDENGYYNGKYKFNGELYDGGDTIVITYPGSEEPLRITLPEIDMTIEDDLERSKDILNGLINQCLPINEYSSDMNGPILVEGFEPNKTCNVPNSFNHTDGKTRIEQFILAFPTQGLDIEIRVE